MIITLILAIAILCMVILVLGSVWRIESSLAIFTEWLRHNNPDGEVGITMGNGDKYKLKMNKESK